MLVLINPIQAFYFMLAYDNGYWNQSSNPDDFHKTDHTGMNDRVRTDSQFCKMVLETLVKY